MFGGRSFLVNEKMVASARQAGNLLVRVDAARHKELVRRPGAGAAQMGPARTMGAGWIEVARGAIDDDESLSAWVAVAMEFNRAATGHRP
ncbi:MAG: TfoX/Sxy family protein [Cryobacterium sp.]|nr:TfoX/Sxy family protein [Cryobacterium sp.]